MKGTTLCFTYGQREPSVWKNDFFLSCLAGNIKLGKLSVNCTLTFKGLALAYAMARNKTPQEMKFYMFR